VSATQNKRAQSETKELNTEQYKATHATFVKHGPTPSKANRPNTLNHHNPIPSQSNTITVQYHHSPIPSQSNTIKIIHYHRSPIPSNYHNPIPSKSDGTSITDQAAIQSSRSWSKASKRPKVRGETGETDPNGAPRAEKMQGK